MPDPTLIVIAGPPLAPARLSGEGPFLLGRSSRCDVRLDDAAVSRLHAGIRRSDETWFIFDAESRHGVALNGSTLARGASAPLKSGDRIQIGPWTLRFRLGDIEPSTLASIDDTARPAARRIPREHLGALAEKRLTLLMDSARAIHSATEEAAVAHAVVDALVAGTGFQRAALIRPQTDLGALNVLAMRNDAGVAPLQPSRSLLQAASEGAVVRIEDRPAIREAVSIISSGVTEALCAPIMVGDAIDSFVYLDSVRKAQPQPDAAAFCAATADLCGLAFANLRRHALQAQQDLLLRDLQAAHDVQKRLMPPASGRIGSVRYAMHFQPGRVVAGDLFGVRAVGEDAVAMFIGDVCGKGLGASLMMATIQSHLDALLDSDRPLPQLISELNRYICRRSASNEFASLWIGIVDGRDQRLTCVDAGHGYAMIRRDGQAEMPRFEGGPPIGVEPSIIYTQTEFQLHPDDRVVLFSDGVPEQSGAGGEQFGVQRILKVLGDSPSVERDLADLTAALALHARSEEFGDDVTIASLALEKPE